MVWLSVKACSALVCGKAAGLRLVKLKSFKRSRLNYAILKMIFF